MVRVESPKLGPGRIIDQLAPWENFQVLGPHSGVDICDNNSIKRSAIISMFPTHQKMTHLHVESFNAWICTTRHATSVLTDWQATSPYHSQGFSLCSLLCHFTEVLQVHVVSPYVVCGVVNCK